MKSNTIKSVIIDAKKVLKSGDLKLENPQNRYLISNISKLLNKEFKSNPRTVSAIVKYIEDHGYELRHLECADTQTCRNNMIEALQRVSPEDMKSIRAICESMFRQPIREKD